MIRLKPGLDSWQLWHRYRLYKGVLIRHRVLGELLRPIFEGSRPDFLTGMLYQKGMLLLDWVLGVRPHSYVYELRGPYSEWWSDAPYQARMWEGATQRQKCPLKPYSTVLIARVEEAVEVLCRLWENCPSKQIKPTLWLQLLASIVFRRHQARRDGKELPDTKAIFAELATAGEPFTKDDVKFAWDRLAEEGLITVLDELQPWLRLSYYSVIYEEFAGLEKLLSNTRYARARMYSVSLLEALLGLEKGFGVAWNGAAPEVVGYRGAERKLKQKAQPLEIPSAHAIQIRGAAADIQKIYNQRPPRIHFNSWFELWVSLRWLTAKLSSWGSPLKLEKAVTELRRRGKHWKPEYVKCAWEMRKELCI